MLGSRVCRCLGDEHGRQANGSISIPLLRVPVRQQLTLSSGESVTERLKTAPNTCGADIRLST